MKATFLFILFNLFGSTLIAAKNIHFSLKVSNNTNRIMLAQYAPILTKGDYYIVGEFDDYGQVLEASKGLKKRSVSVEVIAFHHNKQISLKNAFATLNEGENIVDYRVVAYKNTDNYVISVSNIIECKKKLHIHVPNAFSPDGDGINDTFAAVSDGVEDYIMDVYNRWGEVVFHSENISESWNGEYKGIKSVQDAYVYVISARAIEDGQPTILKGTVSLIR